MARSGLSKLVDSVRTALAGSGHRDREDGRRDRAPRDGRDPRPDRGGASEADRHDGVSVSYAPELDGDPDPGEVVWAWVPYEEDASQGKDRPVLVIGLHGDELACLPLSSKDHVSRGDASDWVSIGSGGWDRAGRPSFVDAGRVLRLSASAVRREGAALERDRFDAVIARMRDRHGWPG